MIRTLLETDLNSKNVTERWRFYCIERLKPQTQVI
jgi:hypothetical protein